MSQAFTIQSPGGTGSCYWDWLKVAQPAAGNDWNVTIPTGEEWELLTVQWKLVTGTITQDRNTIFNIWDSSDSVDLIREPFSGLCNLGGGAIYLFYLSQGRPLQGAVYGSSIGRQILGGLPNRNRYPGGYVFGSTSPNRRTDDQLQEIRCSIIRYIHA